MAVVRTGNGPGDFEDGGFKPYRMITQCANLLMKQADT